jgi:type II secretory pathway pseudopilin PulG
MSKMRNVYPSKRDMNLAMRENPQTNRPIAVLAVLLVIAFIGVFYLFAVRRVLDEVDSAAAAADNAEAQLAAIQEQTARYDDVLDEYQSYTVVSNAMTGTVNPLDCLNLIETQLVDKAQVESYSVADHLVSVQLSGVTLRDVSEIYASLTASPLVSNVQVYTASTQKDSTEQVTATMNIELAQTDTSVTDPGTNGQ